MGGLAHHFESAGIATTQISLVRLHSEKMQPPRALWVPFELGRPFGPPGDAAFQRAVVLAALKLLEAERGPLLEDYPVEAPAADGDGEGWVCPVSFARPPAGDDGAALRRALDDEMARLQPWYDQAVAARGRTTFGASTLTPAAIAELLIALGDDELPESPIADVALDGAARLAAEDLKAWYFEAAAAQPGDASSARLGDWFWNETTAGQVLRRVGDRLARSEDPALKFTGQALMVPRSQA